MANAFVVKRKPFFYKLGAKIFKWLVLSNKVVEYERLGKVIETDRTAFQGHNIAWQGFDELKEEHSSP
jgi:hypothetical protein